MIREHEAITFVVDQVRSFPAQRLGEKRHWIETAVEGGGMELDELEIGETNADPRRHRQSVSGDAGRVGGSEIEAADPTGGEHHGRGLDDFSVPMLIGDHQPHDSLVGSHQIERPPSLQCFDRGPIEHGLGQSPHHLVAGAVAFGVDDPAALVPGLAGKSYITGGGDVESSAEVPQPLDGSRATVGEDVDRVTNCDAARDGHRVAGMQVGAIVAAHCRGDTPLRPPCRAERARGNDDRLSQPERCRKTGDARTDHQWHLDPPGHDCLKLV